MLPRVHLGVHRLAWQVTVAEEALPPPSKYPSMQAILPVVKWVTLIASTCRT